MRATPAGNSSSVAMGEPKPVPCILRSCSPVSRAPVAIVIAVWLPLLLIDIDGPASLTPY